MSGRQALGRHLAGVLVLAALVLQWPIGLTTSSSSHARRLVWSDEFDGPAGKRPNPANWSFSTGGRWGNGRELQCYTKRARNASHDGRGNLRIVARRERHSCGGTGNRYTSARIHTNDKREFQYGVIKARMKIPPGHGIWPAFWTLGFDAESRPWPDEGEIDILEVIGREPRVAQHHVHGATASGDHWQVARNRVGPAWHNDFHVYAIRWSEGRIEFRVDGVSHGAIDRTDLPATWSWPFDKPHYLLLNVAVGGPRSWPGAPDPGTRFPASLLVDWVRVLQ
jgi:beta-glucanase (GH16 family)